MDCNIGLKIACVYKIKSITTGGFYIGSTKQFNRRCISHLSKLRNGVHPNKMLQSITNLYGVNDLKFEVVETVNDPNLLIKREQYYLDNVTPEFNVSRIATKPSNTRKKTGRPPSDEVKRKLSIANTGKKRTSEQREVTRQANLGKISMRRRKVVCIETGLIYDHAGIVASGLGCTTAAICMVCNGQFKTAKGFHFSYVQL